MESRSYERGRFYIGPNGFPRFAGSSSGVYLADTVRAEIESNNNTSEIEQAFVFRNNDGESREGTSGLYDQYLLRSSDLLEETPLRERVTAYFTNWHPLFPFLDGAYLIQCFDNAVAIAKLGQMVDMSLPQSSASAQRPPYDPFAFEGLSAHESLVLSAVCRAIFTIGHSEVGQPHTKGNPTNGGGGGKPPGNHLPIFKSTQEATMLAHLIVSATQMSGITEVFALQGLLAIQLYLYCMRKPRPAMHLSGTAIKLAYEAGLHRCPERYSTTFKTASERDLRKRVFYSLYVIDRLLSAEFGIPLMLADSDIDTCLPGGEEKHEHGGSSPEHPARTPLDYHEGSVRPDADGAGLRDSSRIGKRRRLEDEGGSPYSPSTNRHTDLADGRSTVGQPAAVAAVPPKTEPTLSEGDIMARKRLLPALSLVKMASMIGRAMETFNKSLRHRSVNSNEVLALRADLDQWWNDIGLDCGREADDPRHHFAILFTCLYHQQIINLNRPMLSVSPTKTQHVAALQSTIASVRIICSQLNGGLNSAEPFLYWPGYLDMVFFGSLILVYGFRLGDSGSRLPDQHLRRDLERIMFILTKLQRRWNNLKAIISIVQSFVASADIPDKVPAQEAAPLPTQTYMTNPFDSTWNTAGNVPLMGMAQNGMPPVEASASNFFFDFDTFELNPESMWAYQMSIPASPNR